MCAHCKFAIEHSLIFRPLSKPWTGSLIFGLSRALNPSPNILLITLRPRLAVLKTLLLNKDLLSFLSMWKVYFLIYRESHPSVSGWGFGPGPDSSQRNKWVLWIAEHLWCPNYCKLNGAIYEFPLMRSTDRFFFWLLTFRRLCASLRMSSSPPPPPLDHDI